MRILIDGRARLIKGVVDPGTGEPTIVFVACSRDLAALALAAAATSQHVRELALLVNYPVYLPGFTLAVPGWNPEARVFYDEPPDLVGLAPASAGWLEVLDDLFVDFPLKDAASVENAYGLPLTLVLRPAIEGPIPFHLVMASLERTGKGKLIDTGAGMAVTGQQVSMMQVGSTEEEREKRITSLVLAGASIIHLDNIPGGEVVDSPSLASLATAYPKWRGRLLGKSLAPDLPNRLVVVMSGNNVSATGELVKRSVPIVLEALDDHPERRTEYAHPDCLAYAGLRRRAVLEALLGLVENWKAKGRPKPLETMGGFERWVHAVGGALFAAGATSWMTNYTAWVGSADDFGADTEILVGKWWAKFGPSPVSAAQVFEIARTAQVFREAFRHPTELGQIVSFSRKVLAMLVNRPVQGHVVRRSGSGSSSTYAIESATP